MLTLPDQLQTEQKIIRDFVQWLLTQLKERTTDGDGTTKFSPAEFSWGIAEWAMPPHRFVLYLSTLNLVNIDSWSFPEAAHCSVTPDQKEALVQLLSRRTD